MQGSSAATETNADPQEIDMIMPASTKIVQQINMAEERLRLAMLASDCQVLDELISPELVFTNHFGQLFQKHDDLELHRSGILKFKTIEPSEMQVKADDGFSVVSVRMKVAGTYSGVEFATDLRYTRIWRVNHKGTWQIVAGHSSIVA